jgi:hypothetical protein
MAFVLAGEAAIVESLAFAEQLCSCREHWRNVVRNMMKRKRVWSGLDG